MCVGNRGSGNVLRSLSLLFYYYHQCMILQATSYYVAQVAQLLGRALLDVVEGAEHRNLDIWTGELAS